MKSKLVTFRLDPYDFQQLEKDMAKAGVDDRTAYIKLRLFGAMGEHTKAHLAFERVEDELNYLAQEIRDRPTTFQMELLLQRFVVDSDRTPPLPEAIDRVGFQKALYDIGQLTERQCKAVLALMEHWEYPDKRPVSMPRAVELWNACLRHGLKKPQIDKFIEILYEIGAVPPPREPRGLRRADDGPSR